MTWSGGDTPTDDLRQPQDDVVGADPVAEAFRVWMRTCARAGWVAAVGVEVVGVAAAGGRVTAEPMRALWSVPAYRAAAMDGIAVHAADTNTATPQRALRLLPAEFDRVDTGDLVPDGRDAVIMREHVRLINDGSAEIDTSVAPGRHVRRVGEDIQAGQLVLPAGHRIRPVDMAALAAAGHHTMRVRHQPVVAIVPTGDEVRPFGADLAPGEVLDTNSLMLAGMTEEAGGEVLRMPIAPDRPDQIAATVAQAARRADVVLVIAGSSAGRGDHTATVVRRLGAIAVHGVAMRPGHPVLLGVLSGDRLVPVVGVPGYPASAERAFECFVRPLLRRVLETAGSPDEIAVPARLACAVSSAQHLDEYLRVRLARIVDPRTGRHELVVTPLQRGAGALNAIVQTEAVLRIPVGSTGFAAGAEVRPIPIMGAAFSAETTIISGVNSPATDALLEMRRREIPPGSVQWTESGVREASEALSTGLCHAAALALDRCVVGTAADPISALVTRIGDITVLEVARTASTSEALVLPAQAFDSPPIVALRTVLRSTAFRCRLLRCDGYSGRSAGRETWHGPHARRTE
ncbi:MAG TPA: molybdopterin-binding protein [Pseudonocardiaceae bacterium]|nr:molybdopterin-binding protein [Pseudonocardiaceae bacterium]